MASGTSSNSSETTVVGAGGRKEIMLFGFRVVVDPMRKCVSLNNLSEYQQPEEILKKIGGVEEKNKADAAAGYASADDAVPVSSSGGNRERRRGIPWTEEEHKLFLLGLQKVGKGDWKGISKNFVKTRTPTQVASHAQKYFIRRSNLNRRRRRSSLFDMTTETVTADPDEIIPEQKLEKPRRFSLCRIRPVFIDVTGVAMDEDQVHTQENASHSRPLLLAPETNNGGGHSVTPVFSNAALPMPTGNLLENSSLGQPSRPNNSSMMNPVHLVPVTFQALPSFSQQNMNKNSTADPSRLSLNLSLASPTPKEWSSNHSAVEVMRSSFNVGDSNSIMSVA